MAAGFTPPEPLVDEEGMYRPSASTPVVLALALVCGCSEPETEFPADARGTVETVAKGLSRGELDIVWDAMPPSYRKDLNDLVNEFGAHLDADTYDDVLRLVGKIGHVLRDKKRFFLGSTMTTNLVADKDVAAKWDALVGLFDAVIESELSSASAISRMDVGEFMRGNGRKIMARLVDLGAIAPEDPFSLLGDITVEEVRVTDDITTLRLSAPAKPEIEWEFTNVEGRWVPVEISTRWKRNIERVKMTFEKMALGRDRDTKLQTKMSLKMAEQIVDRLAQCQTQKIFDDTLSPVIGGLFGSEAVTPPK